jgi:RND family efflux transporter MFP subunit
MSATAVGCGGERTERAAAKTEPLVSIAKVIPAAPSQSVILSGQLRAEHETALGFRIAGKIASRKVDAGQTVKAGDVLFTLDAADYQLKVDAMRASETAAKAVLDNAGDELARHSRMLEKDLVSQAQFDRVQSSFNQAKAGYDAAVAARVNAENDLRYTQLVADAPAIISEVLADAGQVVAAGTPVLMTANANEMEAEAYIPEKFASRVKIGDKAAIRISALAPEYIEGTVREVAGMADPRTRTYRARFGFAKATVGLRLGMTADVRIDVPLARPGVLVPPEAICDGDTPHVWVYGPDSQALRRDVVVEGAQDGAFIVSGIEPGTSIIVEGARYINTPQKVRTVEGTAAPKAE